MCSELAGEGGVGGGVGALWLSLFLSNECKEVNSTDCQNQGSTTIDVTLSKLLNLSGSQSPSVKWKCNHNNLMELL